MDATALLSGQVIGYQTSRTIHLATSGFIAAIALVHIALAVPTYRVWSPDAVWFVGTGIGLLVLATLNLAHIGVEPCHQPTARFVRAVNWLYAAFALVTLLAVPEPQAVALASLLLVQGIVASRTLPGPRKSLNPEK